MPLSRREFLAAGAAAAAALTLGGDAVAPPPVGAASASEEIRLLTAQGYLPPDIGVTPALLGDARAAFQKRHALPVTAGEDLPTTMVLRRAPAVAPHRVGPRHAELSLADAVLAIVDGDRAIAVGNLALPPTGRAHRDDRDVSGGLPTGVLWLRGGADEWRLGELADLVGVDSARRTWLQLGSTQVAGNSAQLRRWVAAGLLRDGLRIDVF